MFRDLLSKIIGGENLNEGLEQSAASIDSWAALEKLESLIQFTHDNG